MEARHLPGCCGATVFISFGYCDDDDTEYSEEQIQEWLTKNESHQALNLKLGLALVALNDEQQGVIEPILLKRGYQKGPTGTNYTDKEVTVYTLSLDDVRAKFRK